MMKPATWVSMLGLALAAAGCSQSPEQRTAAAQVDDGWTQPPFVTSVARAGATLIIDGAVEPGARVVLRSESDAYAASADERGRFQIRIVAPNDTLLLKPETQVGQDAAASPDRLLIVDGGKGPIAVLRPGQTTRRLDAAPVLAAVDSDGRQVLASGRSADLVRLAAEGRAATATPDRSGRWSLLLDTAQAKAMRIQDRTYNWPGEGGGAPDGGPLVERAGAGWRVNWMSGGSRLATWLPDA